MKSWRVGGRVDARWVLECPPILRIGSLGKYKLVANPQDWLEENRYL
ncbi:hypothetical protein [Persicobacter psychrovividus]|uniref:Uncharacterized protein n=1 Tax=Persicobacter psychrovividus TaxID=387638 RepID=A0ABM7VKA1_9BACT|nr:hypothetical protein PEPS_36900 [Persicobacter psychrovividus]